MRAESTAPLHILAADIGGTHARFAAATVDDRFRAELGPVFSICTRQPGVKDFPGFWELFQRVAPGPLANTGGFDAVALAVAGSVSVIVPCTPKPEWALAAGIKGL